MARPDRTGHGGKRTLSAGDTIFALASGSPPAAIAIIRISGPSAFRAAAMLTGTLPAPRIASLRTLRDVAGDILDRALVLVFPAAVSVTGEDLVELHCHGGRAVVAAVERALAAVPALRQAKAGEFSRRALLNGRIDLAQAEALGDLLRAETEQERRTAQAGVDGAVSKRIGAWQASLLDLAARIEALIEFDEDDSGIADALSLSALDRDIAMLCDEMMAAAAAPTVERLREGFRLVLAGPRNAGKSTLFNLLIDREAAIVSPIAGTTRDRIEAPVQRDGVGYVVVDTAGLTEDSADLIEIEGVSLAKTAIAMADLVLWLGDTAPAHRNAIWVWARSDVPGRENAPAGTIAISNRNMASIQQLWRLIAECNALAGRSGMAFNQRHVANLLEAANSFCSTDDLLLMAEQVRSAQSALAAVSHSTSVEAVLDKIFASFCIGK